MKQRRGAAEFFKFKICWFAPLLVDESVTARGRGHFLAKPLPKGIGMHAYFQTYPSGGRNFLSCGFM